MAGNWNEDSLSMPITTTQGPEVQGNRYTLTRKPIPKAPGTDVTPVEISFSGSPRHGHFHMKSLLGPAIILQVAQADQDGQNGYAYEDIILYSCDAYGKKKTHEQIGDQPSMMMIII